jgi:alpha-L-fucosidase
VPAWWRDAKFGVFIHWTMASVPAFAPTNADFSEMVARDQRSAFAASPYVEWYENSLRFRDSPVAQFHREHFGDAPYRDFRTPFEAAIDAWDPEQWVAPIAASGARYVVVVAKHADGFCLWPTSVDNPHVPNWHSRRDVVGELAVAVRAAGMRFGIYYSGGMDWTFEPRPIGSMADVIAAIPRGQFPAYAEAQVRELIERYQPSVLWNDIAWPQPGRDLWQLFTDYYAAVPDGVVNDRWLPWSPALALARNRLGARAIDALTQRQFRKDGGIIPPRPPFFDVRTPEYMTFPEIQRTPFEVVRGMDQSFGYNAHSSSDDFIGRDELLWMLTDITAKGGNLLLNVGPRGVDAAVPPEQVDRLEWMGAWLRDSGDALRGTRPWVTAGSDNIRYTTRNDTVFAYVRRPEDSVTLTGVRSTSTTSVHDGAGTTLQWRDGATGLAVDLNPKGGQRSDVPVIIALNGVVAAPQG